MYDNLQEKERASEIYQIIAFDQTPFELLSAGAAGRLV